MSGHIGLRQLNPHGENADRKDDSGELQSDRIGDIVRPSSPSARIEYICAVWTCYE